jgi:hypothetical protein
MRGLFAVRTLTIPDPNHPRVVIVKVGDVLPI